MNILQVTLGFYPATAWGGPVKVVHQNCMELLRRGHRVTICCTNLLDKHHKIAAGTFEREVDGLRVVYHNTWNLPKWPGTLGPFWLPGLGNWLRDELRTFDVVHINGYRTPLTLEVARAATRYEVPYVMQPHGAIPIIMNTRFLKRVYDRFLGWQELAGLSALIALQPSERRQALTVGVPNHKIVEIANGMVAPDKNALPPLGAFRAKHGIPSDCPLILFLGRINRKKGTDMLVEAFARISTRNAFLVIAGPDDGQLAEVQGLVQTYKLTSRVGFPGLLNGDDIWAAYRDADLFVLPCRTDTFPMAIVESCAMGTPVLTTTGCEIAHLVDGKIGEAVPFDAGRFAEAVDTLLSNRDRRDRYVANTGSMMASIFSLGAVVDRLESVYRAVAAHAPLPQEVPSC